MRRLVFTLSLTLALPPWCSGQDGPPPPALPAETTLLFVGNSLTYTHDLPGAVTAVARSLGQDVASVDVAYPNFALEDHWHQGIAGVIRRLRPDVVVLQQGPSSLPQNQLHLAAWTDSLARVAREVGAETALLMVWPSRNRAFAFDDVRDAYRDAAEKVDGRFIPAGEALRVLAGDEPALDPFGADGFHPSSVGSLLAAMVTAGTLLDVDLTALPDTLPPGRYGSTTVPLEPELGDLLRNLADSVVQAWR